MTDLSFILGIADSALLAITVNEDGINNPDFYKFTSLEAGIFI